MYLPRFLEEKFLVKKFMRTIMSWHFMMLILKKKIHILVIPKGEYVDLDDFNNKASDKEILELNKAITHVSKLLGAKDKGYRALTNIGSDGGQEVPHLHFHIFAGEKIGKMVS